MSTKVVGLDLNIGETCNDNDACTVDDIVTSDCQCVGTYLDSDNDGTCDAEDICPDSPEPGTACDDGNDTTINDEITADCVCLGEDPNSINESILTFKIYPNPVRNDLIIEAQGKVHIAVYSLGGALLLEHEMTDQKRLDLSQLNSGIYILSLSNETSKGYQKIMKL